MKQWTGRALFKRSGGKRSIFRALFVPLLLLMVLQAALFYFAAVYGGVQETLRQNAADILSERMTNRANELEGTFNAKWTELSGCTETLAAQYAAYELEFGAKPFAQGSDAQIRFLDEAADTLVSTLRRNEVNGIFLILNDQRARADFPERGSAQKYGLCIRDIDPNSNYTGREDLQLERAPSSIVESVGCPLDSWWEARYSFASEAEGDFYYAPLAAAWDNPGASGGDLAYLSGAHRISRADHEVVSYSVPLLDETGFPYAVLGVELTARYLGSLLPSRELNEPDKSCYVLALCELGTERCTPIVGTGALYSRCFEHGAVISTADAAETGGFTVQGRDGTALYGASTQLRVYNNNNPFEQRALTLLAFVESKTLFSYIDRVKGTLLLMSLITLALGVAGIVLESRRFAAPITALAARVRSMKPQSGFTLERLGITEIDALVDAIEGLNSNVGKNIARTEFYSRMSHDMRTPMNAVITFSSPELLEGASEKTKDDYLEKIHSSGEYLLGLINEVLDMTKIESDKTELHRAPARAAGLFDTSVTMVERLAEKKGVRFTSELSCDPALYVTADVQHLNQIVMNLLSNAVKFTPEGGFARFCARIAEDPVDPSRVLCDVTVSDSGIGMSEAFMEKLYTPFEQENANLEGTGLGLSIARKLTELMGGTIACESKRGEGTTFRIALPLETCAALPSEPPAAATAETSLAGRRVLVCEDHPINTVIARQVLERRGILVDTAANGQEGVERFAASAPDAYDAILMDIRMPVMDGLAAARAIRALPRPDAATVPILAMTANAFDEDVAASSAAGMNEHLSKPIEPAKLYAALETWIAARERG